jgi:hypothetical protein
MATGGGALKDAARRRRRWPAAILDRGAARSRECCRPGPENGAAAQPENDDRGREFAEITLEGLTHKGPLQKGLFAIEY